jgi:hypothetical protein
VKPCLYTIIIITIGVIYAELFQTINFTHILRNLNFLLFRHLRVRSLINQFLSLFLGETLLPIETGQEAGGLGSAPCPALDPVSQAREYRGGGTLPRHGLEQVCTCCGSVSAVIGRWLWIQESKNYPKNKRRSVMLCSPGYSLFLRTERSL